MDKQIIISAVHYLNTKPFLYGLQKAAFRKKMVLSMDTPAECANKLQNGQITIGLVPVAILPKLKGAKYLPDWGIAADGEVASVCLYSQVPLNEVEEIFLDYQSRTSNLLLKILLREYYGKAIKLTASFPGYEDQIKGKIAGLIIGDRSLFGKEKYKYAYDLAGAWKTLTGLPFVFALWVYQENLEAGILHQIDEAFEYGITRIPDIVADYAEAFASVDVHSYLTKSIKYKLDDRYLKGMELFFEKCALITDKI
jgi:chorismate dehydratase